MRGDQIKFNLAGQFGSFARRQSTLQHIIVKYLSTTRAQSKQQTSTMPTATKLKIPSRPTAKTVTAITVNLRNAPPDFIRDENSTLTTAAADDVSINNAEQEVLRAKAGSKVRLCFSFWFSRCTLGLFVLTGIC